jgi:hypothetical protein
LLFIYYCCNIEHIKNNVLTTIIAIVILAIVPARTAFLVTIYWFEYRFYLHFVSTAVILRNHHGLYKKNSFSEANNHSSSREVSHHLMELVGQ